MFQTGQRLLPALGPVTNCGRNPPRSFAAPTGGPDFSGSAVCTLPPSRSTARAALAMRRGVMGEIPLSAQAFRFRNLAITTTPGAHQQTSFHIKNVRFVGPSLDDDGKTARLVLVILFR